MSDDPTEAEQAVVKRVCEAVRVWAQATGNGAVLRAANVDIPKSGLMYRLLYLGESLRTTPCPYHKRHMDTSLWELRGVGCCDGRGWLENDPDAIARRREFTLRLLKDGDWQGGVLAQARDARILYGQLPEDYMAQVFGGGR